MGTSHILIGSRVDGRSDFSELKTEARINRKLTLAAAKINKISPLYNALQENKEFSLNIFSGDLLNSLGIRTVLSGNGDCKDRNFSSFDGNLMFAPMIINAPLSLECAAYEIVHLEDTAFVMADVKAVWSFGSTVHLNENIGLPDLSIGAETVRCSVV